MRTSSVIMIISLLILLLSLGYLGFEQYKKSRQGGQVSFATISPVVRPVMVLDINQTGIFTPELVLTGRLPIIALHQGTDPQDHSKDLLSFLDNIGRLVPFDRTNDDRLDIHDPVFSELELVFLNKGRIFQVVPFPAVGIRQIFLDREKLTPEELYPNGPKGYWGAVNVAILADGTKRMIRVIPMNVSDLPNPAVYNKSLEIGNYQVPVTSANAPSK